MDSVVQAFAVQFKVPEREVRKLAALVAERCALVANRYEPIGELEAVEWGVVEAIGAQIGAAILQEFPPPEPLELRPKPRIGIGGPPGYRIQQPE